MDVIKVISKQERLNLIREMALYYIENEGMTFHELADTYGRPYSTVYNWMVYQLPKIDNELYNHLRNSMKNEKEVSYSRNRVKIHRSYSCIPELLKLSSFNMRVTTSFPILWVADKDHKPYVDWNEISELLFQDSDSHGFNYITSIKSHKDFLELYELVKQGDKMPWHKITCKSCGKTFVLTKGNYEFFTQEHMYLPTHCGKCRWKRRMRNEHKNAKCIEH